MSRLATSFVLGYHGCDRAIAEQAVGGEIPLLKSEKKHDWLGSGAYFWESDARRAMEWATDKATRGKLQTPAVVGAVIDLRNCLDLVSRENLDLVRDAHRSFVVLQTAAGLTVPRNTDVRDDERHDKPLRYLDRAVIEHLHELIEESGGAPYDTVRGMFPEGGELYEGSGFRDRNHIQIAVCNLDCILGVFWPPGMAKP